MFNGTNLTLNSDVDQEQMFGSHERSHILSMHHLYSVRFMNFHLLLTNGTIHSHLGNQRAITPLLLKTS